MEPPYFIIFLSDLFYYKLFMRTHLGMCVLVTVSVISCNLSIPFKFVGVFHISYSIKFLPDKIPAELADCNGNLNVSC
nr:MAG TPA: hypothetical protein [Caudoviricetes sp.]